MKKLLILTTLIIISSNTYAVTRTMQNTGEKTSGDTKVCFYEGGGNEDFITIPNERSCPATKTFEIDE